MQEHVTFSHRDVVQGLGAVHLESTSQWPQTTLLNHILRPPVEEQNFVEATTSTTPSTAEEDMTECVTPLPRLGVENQYVFVATDSVGQLNLGPHGDDPKGSRAENIFWKPRMVTTFPRSTRVNSYEGAVMKELDEYEM